MPRTRIKSDDITDSSITSNDLATTYLTPTGDGSSLTGIDALPTQTGNSGKFLTTDGTSSSWSTTGKTGTGTFAGSGGETTVAHGLGSSPSYAQAVPTSDPNGYLGETWVRSDATNIYVGNSGSHTGSFSWYVVA